MNKIRVFLFLALLSLSLTGCISTKSFVDPTFGKVKYEDLQRKKNIPTWRLVAEFKRNGSRLPAVDSELMGHVERVIRASGVAVPTSEGSAPELKVIVDNVADIGSAVGKGIGTGLTFGLAGSTVSDYYEMEIVLTYGKYVYRKTGYKHAIHSTVGNASAPQGLEPMTPSAAFGKVVEQLLLNALKDMEKEKQISLKFPFNRHITFNSSIPSDSSSI